MLNKNNVEFFKLPETVNYKFSKLLKHLVEVMIIAKKNNNNDKPHFYD